MNDIINWIALNNTLMIRIGFSAVVLLLVVYAFRFFFMPSISVISTDAASADSSSKDNSDMHIEELAELQGEIDTLKAKLKELQAVGAKPVAATATAAAPAPVSAAGLETVSAEPPPAAVVESVSKELKEKLKTLEARLSEYEIIAEEIAEIGKLRLENQKLKEKMAAAPVETGSVAVESEPEPEPELEVKVESVTANSDSEIDALLGAVAEENTAADAQNPLAAEDEAAALLGGVDVAAEEDIVVAGAAEPAPEKELFIIHSDVEVTEEEKELINSFEEIKKV